MKEQVTEIVAAYLRRNSVAPSDVPAVIIQVYQTLAGLGQPAPEEVGPAALKPAVPVRRSVAAEAITCLECGTRGMMIRRHLKTAHNLAPQEYRQRWNLPSDYPMVAPQYAARRSALAKAIGLGKGRRRDGKSEPAK